MAEIPPAAVPADPQGEWTSSAPNGTRASPPEEPVAQGLARPARDEGRRGEAGGRGLLSLEPVRALWVAVSLSTLGDWLGLLSVTALAASLATSSYLAAGAAVAAVFALRVVPGLPLEPFGGLVAERVDRRWTMVASDVVRCALFVSIPVVGTLWWLLAATFLIEIARLAWAAAKDAAVPALVPPEQRDEADQLGLVTTYLIAPAAGAFFALLALLAAALGAGIPFFRANPVDLALYVTAATFLFAAVAAVEVPATAVTVGRHTAPAPGVIRTLLERRHPGNRLTSGLLLGLVGAVAAGGALVGAARLYVRDLGGGNAAYGVLFAAVFVGLALGVAIGPRLLPRLSRRRLLGIASCLVGASLAFLALVPNLVLVVVLAFLTGFCGGIAWTTGSALLRHEFDDDRRTHLMAFVHSVVHVVLIAGLTLTPLLAGAIGVHRFTLTDAVSVDYNGAPVILLAVGLLALLVGLVAYQRIDDRRGASVVGDVRMALRARPVPLSGEALGGYFIAFEGGEGAGKSSQAERLASFLIDRGHEVVLTFEPGSTPVGRMLRMTLLDPAREAPTERAEALLYAADRADHVHNVVRPALERGAIVVTDRYTDSSVAYQGAGRALPVEDVAYLSEWATDALVPDVSVLLDVPPEIGLARRGTELDRLESEPAEFHDRVRAAFLALAQRHPARYVVIDASLPFEEAAVRIRQSLQRRLPLSPRERNEIEERRRRQDEERLQAEQEERRRNELEAERRRVEAEDARRRADAEAAAARAEEQERRQQNEALRLRREEEDRRRRLAETEASRQRLSDSEIRRRVAREEAFRYLYADTQADSAAPPPRTQDADLADEILGATDRQPNGRPASEGRHRAGPTDDPAGDPDEEHTQLLPRIDP